MRISVTGNNEIRLLTFMFAIKRKKNEKASILLLQNKQTNKVKWNIDRRS